MNKKNILVIGGGGFIANSVINSLIDHNLYLLDSNIEQLNKLKKIYSDASIYLIKFDLNKMKSSSFERLDNIFFKKDKKLLKKNFDSIIYLASIDHKVDEIGKKISQSNLDYKSFMYEYEIGIYALVNLIEYYIDRRKRNSKIILLGSDLGTIAPNQNIYKKSGLNFIKPVSYSIIKHGLHGLMKYYATLLASRNISINMISPTGIKNNQDSKFINNLIIEIPSKRMCNLEDLESVFKFLISSSNFITGQNIHVDGGRTLW